MPETIHTQARGYSETRSMGQAWNPEPLKCWTRTRTLDTSTAEALAGLALAGFVSTSGLFRDFLQGVPETHLREDATPAELRDTADFPTGAHQMPQSPINRGRICWQCFKPRFEATGYKSMHRECKAATGVEDVWGRKRAMQKSP